MSISDFTFKVEKICKTGSVVDEVLLKVEGPTGCFDKMDIEQQTQYFSAILYKLLGENSEYGARFPIGAKIRMILLEEKPRRLQ